MSIDAAQGTHYVTVTDADGCPTVCSHKVLEGPCGGVDGCDLVADIGQPNLLCPDSTTVQLFAFAGLGTPPYQYAWSSGETTSAIDAISGDYQVTITDADGCETVAFETVMEGPCGGVNGCKLTCDIVGSQLSVCQGQTMDLYVSAAGGTGNYTFTYTDPSGNSMTSTGASLVIEDATEGEYTVAIQDLISDCCSTCSYTVIGRDIPCDISIIPTITKPCPPTTN